MYFENNRQLEIAHHKINYFLDYIRTRFYLSTEKLDAHFYRSLALRSNHTEEDLKRIFKQFLTIQNAQRISNEQLQNLEKTIQEFKTKADGQ